VSIFEKNDGFIIARLSGSRFDLQSFATILTSTLKTTAQMMTADSVVFGMKAQYGISTDNASSTTDPVT
jgi:hypothetical protein